MFNSKLFDYLKDDDACVLERDALGPLAKASQLKVFRHEGFWQCMDTYRDYLYLQELWNKNEAQNTIKTKLQ